MKDSWTFPRNLTRLSDLRSKVQGFLQQLGMAESLVYKVTLCVDEAASNIVKYAGLKPPPNPPESFILEAIYEKDLVLFVFTDRGVPYDPTLHPKVNLMQHILTGNKGGLGLHIIRTSLEIFGYERRGDSNIFTLGLKHTAP